MQFLPMILSLLAATGASYAGNRQARAQQEEMNRREQAERERQRAIQAEADARLRETTARFSPEQMQQDVAAAQQERTAAVAPAVQQGPQPDYSVATASAPKEVGADLGRRIAEARQRGFADTSNLAALRSFGDASLGQAFALQRAGQDIGRLQRDSRASANLLPGEFRAAANKGQRWGQAASIADLISQAAANYGAAKGVGAGGGSNASGGIKPPSTLTWGS